MVMLGLAECVREDMYGNRFYDYTERYYAIKKRLL